MNVDTKRIYIGQEEIDAAKARGENIIELSDGITKQMYSIEQAQALARPRSMPKLFQRKYESPDYGKR